jgi:uncharacterized membrane protein
LGRRAIERNREMRTGREIFWVLVFIILGLVAAGFAFAAQAKRIKVRQIHHQPIIHPIPFCKVCW